MEEQPGGVTAKTLVHIESLADGVSMCGLRRKAKTLGDGSTSHHEGGGRVLCFINGHDQHLIGDDEEMCTLCVHRWEKWRYHRDDDDHDDED